MSLRDYARKLQEIQELHNMVINTQTKLVGLLGYPLSQSLSTAMHNAAFSKCNLNKIYIPIEVVPENLETVVKGISKMNFEGFNITKPYKIDIIKYIDEIDDYAKYIGAVNTVTIKEGKLKGYNTDGTGFLRSFEENIGSIKDKTVFILGSGGAARAISMSLALNQVKKIYICNRTYNKAVILSNDINRTNIISVAVPMEENKIKKALSDSDVLINSTSIGMYPNVEESPIDKNLISKNLIVCDAVYNPRKTKLLKDAEEIGCKILTGMYMFIYQGAEAFELWTNEKAPIDLMYEVVNKSLKE